LLFKMSPKTTREASRGRLNLIKQARGDADAMKWAAGRTERP
jgi:hypothetical protein